MRVARRLALVASGVLVAAGSACTSMSGAAGEGEECFVATDCAPGLVCVEQASGARICTGDLSRVGGRPRQRADHDPEGDGGAEDEASDGAAPPASPGVDAGGADAGPRDAGGAVDAGGADAGPPDAGPPDAGPPPEDAGADAD